MSYLNFLDIIGLVSNKEDCLKEVSLLSGVNVEDLDLFAINTYCEKFPDSTLYLDVSNNPSSEGSVKAVKKLVDTGYRNKHSLPIFVLFRKTGLGWEGGLVGTYDFLSENKKSNYVDPKCSSGEFRDFHADLYERLLIKDSWDVKSYSLRSYLSALTIRAIILYNRGEGIGESFILNSTKTRFLINTSLLDKFGNDIYLVFAFNGVELLAPYFVDTKAYLLKQGFTKEDVRLKLAPVRFYDDYSDLTFRGEIEDFDLGNTRRLEHIIIDRKLRFPEEVQNLPQDLLHNKLIQAINLGVHLSKCDRSYIVPMYSITRNEIQFLFPLHILKSVSESPELVIIVGKNENYYNVMTILSLEDAYINSKVLSPYSRGWLQVKESSTRTSA